MKIDNDAVTITTQPRSVIYNYKGCPISKDCLFIATEMFGGPIKLYCQHLHYINDELICNHDNLLKPAKPIKIYCKDCEYSVFRYQIWASCYCKKYGKEMTSNHCA